jgi:hypothetical protein
VVGAARSDVEHRLSAVGHLRGRRLGADLSRFPKS